jgi:hypothetical protein
LIPVLPTDIVDTYLAAVMGRNTPSQALVAATVIFLLARRCRKSGKRRPRKTTATQFDNPLSFAPPRSDEAGQSCEIFVACDAE